MRRLPLCTLAVLLLVLAGCQRLNFEKEATLEAGGAFSRIHLRRPPGRDEGSVKVTADQP